MLRSWTARHLTLSQSWYGTARLVATQNMHEATTGKGASRSTPRRNFMTTASLYYTATITQQNQTNSTNNHKDDGDKKTKHTQQRHDRPTPHPTGSVPNSDNKIVDPKIRQRPKWVTSPEQISRQAAYEKRKAKREQEEKGKWHTKEEPKVVKVAAPTVEPIPSKPIIVTPPPSITSSFTLPNTPSTPSTPSPLVPTGAPLAPQLNLPVGKVVATYTPPPYVPGPSHAERMKQRPGPWKVFKKETYAFYESAIHKLMHPIETIRELLSWENLRSHRPYGLAFKHHFRRFFEGFGFTFKPVAPYKEVLSFSPSKTDLSKYVVLNDNPFGGTSTSRLEMREYVVEEGEEKGTKKYTLVFTGELKNMSPFQTSASRWADDKGRPAFVGTTGQNATVPTPPSNSPSSATPAAPQAQPSPSPMSSTPPPMRSTPPSNTNAPVPPAAGGLASSLSSVPPSTTTTTDVSGSTSASPTAPTLPVSKPTVPPPRAGLINGFAAFISPLYQWPDLDLERYDFISMRVRTDGRPYIFNIRCREGLSSTHGNVYQARLRGELPRPMHKLEVRFDNMVCTQSGRVRSWGTTMPKDRTESFGFSVTGPAGPFELELEVIAAQTGTPEFEQKLRAEREIVEAQERAKKVQRRLADMERREAVARELSRLREVRGTKPFTTGGPPEIVKTIVEKFVTGKNHAETMVDISAYPREVQAEMKKEQEERHAEFQKQLAKELAQAKEDEKGKAAAKKADRLSEAQVKEILAQVDDEIKTEKRAEEADIASISETKNKPR